MGLHAVCQEKRTELDAILADIGAAEELRRRARTLKKEFNTIEEKGATEPGDGTRLLSALHNFQRLVYLHRANSSSDTLALTDALVAEEPNWKDIAELDASESLKKNLAERLIHSAFQHKEGGEFPERFEDTPPISNDKALLVFSPMARGTAEYVVHYCLKHDVPFEVDFSDSFFKRAVVAEAHVEQLAPLRDYLGSKYEVTKQLAISSNSPAGGPDAKDPDRTKRKFLAGAKARFIEGMRSGRIFYVLTEIPTPEDARNDGIPYAEYLKLFFELCNQPWQEIGAAHKTMIERLDSASTLHLIDDDTGTNLRMEIEGMRWVNSTVLKNIPGSEVFAAPRRGSVNGTLISKGRFQYGDGAIIENMKLIIKNGRVVDFDAERGRDALAKIIEADDGKGEGSRHVGEIGIGTNPWLRRHVINPLLVEKISGSAHIALGNAYTYTRYDGQDVSLDNGNRSANGVHWDITTLLQGPNARIVLDKGTDREHTLLRAGRFQDPDLRVLNEGWASALLQAPAYWRKLLTQPDKGAASPLRA